MRSIRGSKAGATTTGKDRDLVIGTDLLTERMLRVIDEGRRVATYKLHVPAGTPW